MNSDAQGGVSNVSRTVGQHSVTVGTCFGCRIVLWSLRLQLLHEESIDGDSEATLIGRSYCLHSSDSAADRKRFHLMRMESGRILRLKTKRRQHKTCQDYY